MGSWRSFVSYEFLKFLHLRRKSATLDSRAFSGQTGRVRKNDALLKDSSLQDLQNETKLSFISSIGAKKNKKTWE